LGGSVSGGVGLAAGSPLAGAAGFWSLLSWAMMTTVELDTRKRSNRRETGVIREE
jgi:hypothetical protein